jgi:hypothetical protein
VASSRPNHFLYTILIVMVMLTIVFTILVINKSNQIKRAREGWPENPARKEPILAISNEVSSLESDIARKIADLAARDRELYRLELELARNRTYYLGDNAIAGTTGGDATYFDMKYKLKESQWKVVRDLINSEKQRLTASREEHASPDRQTFPGLDQAILNRQNETQAVSIHGTAMEAEYNTDRQRLQEQLDALHKEEEVSNKAANTQKSLRTTRIVQLEERIRDLLELELRWLSELEPDGEILQSLADKQYVIINIGRVDKVFPGLLLEIFQYQKGHYLEKGKCEVVDVEDRIATCRIIREIDGTEFPIAKGDMVGNPVFSKDKPKVFALTPDYKRFTRSDLEQFIRATGGIVKPLINDKQLPIGVDYLVAGERSDKIQDNAREHPVQAMTEDQLLKYVQTTLPTK